MQQRNLSQDPFIRDIQQQQRRFEQLNKEYQEALRLLKGVQGPVYGSIAQSHPRGKALADIVTQHALAAVAVPWIPVPGLDIVAAFANTWTMYARINVALGISFSENWYKSIALGIASNIISNVPVMVGAELLKLVPGFGTVASAGILTIVLYATTIAAGVVYLKALAALCSKGVEPTEENLKREIDTQLADKAFIRNSINEAKTDYKSRRSQR